MDGVAAGGAPTGGLSICDLGSFVAGVCLGVAPMRGGSSGGSDSDLISIPNY